MKHAVTLSILLLAAAPCFPQLAREQKQLDFQHLAALYAKQYAPYEWKRDALGFDLLELKPWLEKVGRSKDDLEFYEICAQYVTSLDDVHSGYFLPSQFMASIPIYVDFYDGKPLIEAIDRSQLPERSYPFQVGDELISVDGKLVEEWVREVSRLQSFANPRSTRRWALDQIFFRVQAAIPRAHEIGKEASVVVLRGDGRLETYRIPWEISGEPLRVVGPVPSPRLAGTPDPSPEEEAPAYMRSLRKLSYRRAPPGLRLRGYGRLTPVFQMPDSFRQRLGRGRGDFFFSGTYQAEGRTIGFLRIPSFGSGSFTSELTALRQIQSEVAYFQENVDGVVVDIMRNPGGSGCLAEEILQYLIPYRFRTIGDEVRPTLEWIHEFQEGLDLARQLRAEQWVIDLLAAILNDLKTAYRENRGRTGPLPLCGLSLDLEPARDNAGNLIALRKPLLVVADEFSTSAGDLFAAVIQDNLRAPILGMRTTGGGGVVETNWVGFYSEGYASVTRTLGVRKAPHATSEYPTAPYIENIGVRPDIYVDYMTRENLLQGGAPFVEAFTKAMIDTIEGR